MYYFWPLLVIIGYYFYHSNYNLQEQSLQFESHIKPSHSDKVKFIDEFASWISFLALIISAASCAAVAPPPFKRSCHHIVTQRDHTFSCHSDTRLTTEQVTDGVVFCFHRQPVKWSHDHRQRDFWASLENEAL